MEEQIEAALTEAGARINALVANERRLLDKLQASEKDAARWRAMRVCLVGVDWMYGDPPMQAAIFELHSGVVMAGPEGADAIADAAIEALKQ